MESERRAKDKNGGDVVQSSLRAVRDGADVVCWWCDAGAVLCRISIFSRTLKENVC